MAWSPGETPNPGSEEAIKQGCTCPVMDNNQGKRQPHPLGWWVDVECPLHGKQRRA